MVLCIIPGCGVKSGNEEGISLFRIRIVVDKNGESYKRLTEDRRNAWISQISRYHISTITLSRFWSESLPKEAFPLYRRLGEEVPDRELWFFRIFGPRGYGHG